MTRLFSGIWRWMDLAVQMCRGLFTSAHSYMIFFVTARCNARCDFCFYWEEIESAAQRRECRRKQNKNEHRRSENRMRQRGAKTIRARGSGGPPRTEPRGGDVVCGVVVVVVVG